MKTVEKKNILVNFGGPRDLQEVRPFLRELLTDKEVIRSRLPQFLHNLFFSWVAKRRSEKMLHEYKSMGGGSPIFADTEALAEKLRLSIPDPLVTFHRYLPSTHAQFIENLCAFTGDEIRVMPLFPQFTYATTGSVAKWFGKNLPFEIVRKMRWIKSYPAHPKFVKSHQLHIRRFLTEHRLKDEETILLFSAHGIPQQFVDTGDIYESECRASFEHVMKAFPDILGRLSYQSKFGRGEWIKPYTIDVCEKVNSWCEGRRHVVFIPISFTSDHIETLCEIENDYMSVIRTKGLNAFRVPALTLDENWINAVLEIIQEPNTLANQMLIRV